MRRPVAGFSAAVDIGLNAGTDGRTVTIQGPLKDLAAELGLTHEALCRTLHKLEADGEIGRAEGKIILQHKAAL